MPEIFITQGNLKPSILATLSECGDLTGASAKFSMIAKDGTVKINKASATITDAANKKVRYDWSGTDTDTVGDYYGEFIITYADTKTQTWPKKGDFIIHIRPKYA